MSKKHRIYYKKIILKLYKEDNNISAIAELLRLNRYDVVTVLKEVGIREIETHKQRTERTINATPLIVEMYNSGKTITEISKELKMHSRTISKIVSKEVQGGMRQHDHYVRTTYVNEKFFSQYNEKSCYYAGLLMADGCVFSRKVDKTPNSFTISLQESDKDTLTQFKREIHYSGELYYRERRDNHSDMWTLTVNSQHIASDLVEKFNVTPQKTYTCTPPDLPKEFLKAFLLGYFDGDGCLTYVTMPTGRKQFALSITGTYEICQMY